MVLNCDLIQLKHVICMLNHLYVEIIYDMLVSFCFYTHILVLYFYLHNRHTQPSHVHVLSHIWCQHTYMWLYVINTVNGYFYVCTSRYIMNKKFQFPSKCYKIYRKECVHRMICIENTIYREMFYTRWGQSANDVKVSTNNCINFTSCWNCLLEIKNTQHRYSM